MTEHLPPPEPPPHGHIASPEAARLLGVSTQTIRNRIKAGTLEGQDLLTSEGIRYYALREAVEKEAREKNLPATKGDTGEVMRTTESLVQRVVDAVLYQESEVSRRLDENREEIERQGRKRAAQFDQIKTNQERLIEELSEAVTIMRQAAEREKEYQERVMRIMERERQPWWRRWFGG